MEMKAEFHDRQEDPLTGPEFEKDEFEIVPEALPKGSLTPLEWILATLLFPVYGVFAYFYWMEAHPGKSTLIVKYYLMLLVGLGALIVVKLFVLGK